MPDPIAAPVVAAPVKPTAPKNGAPPGAPQAPPAPLETRPTPDPRMADLEKATKLQAKRAQELASRHKEIETKASNLAKLETEMADWKRLRDDRRRNPGKYLKEEFGEQWYETLTKYQLEGAPTGDLIASEMDERELKLSKQMAEQKADFEKRLQDIQSKDADRQRQEFDAGIVSHLKSNADKYPYITAAEEHGAVLREIQRHFKATARQQPDGSWAAGEVLTAEAAAVTIEKRISDIAEKFANVRDAQLAKAATPNQSSTGSQQPQRNEAPQRRALSTAIPASSTPTRTPPKDDRERMQAAIAAWDATARR